MRFWRIATACLVALCFSLSSLATAAEVTYSGVPGKFKRGAKDKNQSQPQNEDPPKDKGSQKIKITSVKG